MSDSLDFHPSLSKVELAAYVRAQLDASFPDGNRDPLGIYVDEAMERVRHCFKDIHIKRYRHKNSILFDHLNGDQYCSFIYLLSRVALENGGSESLCSKLYLLNKRMFGLDIMYDIKMPDIFYFQHPVGTVLGRANYSDYLVVYQRCSTGSDMNGVYPSFGKGVVLFGNSSVIGNCTIGNNCWISYGSTVFDSNIPDNSIVFGSRRDVVIKKTTKIAKGIAFDV